MTWVSSDSMAGMDHAARSGSMPGMATKAELVQLRDASGSDAESLWLRLMIRHHGAGVEMARAALDLARQPEVRQLATAVVMSQQSEIDIMKQLLDERARWFHRPPVADGCVGSSWWH